MVLKITLMEERILSKARELFFSYGIRSVTMDDIARQMGVSKKTIYQYYSDKNELVARVISDLVNCHHTKVEEYFQNSENAVQEVILQTAAIAEIIQAIKPGVFFELQKYFPETWRLIDGHRSDCVLQAILNNLRRGISEGVYREDLDIEVIAHIRLVQLNSVLNLQDFPPDRFSYQMILNQLTELYLYGIATHEGQKELSIHINRTIQ
jgi:AcrR family transcriptional regulator